MEDRGPVERLRSQKEGRKGERGGGDRWGLQYLLEPGTGLEALTDRKNSPTGGKRQEIPVEPGGPAVKDLSRSGRLDSVVCRTRCCRVGGRLYTEQRILGALVYVQRTLFPFSLFFLTFL